MKNVMKKIVAALTATAMCVTLSLTAFAAKFPDVTKDNYPWAVDAIESMADEGIIKGYEDGTFNPAKTVSKLESLVLISRILGVGNEVNERVVEAAWDVYGEDVAEFELPYGGNEVAYLLAKGILSVEELENYIASANRDDGLKRYEVAVLLTKALDAEKTLDAELVNNLAYADNSDIPANAKKYVAYVSDKDLMQGMDGNRFAPNEAVTRAQAALVLLKLKDATAYTYKNGVVSSCSTMSRLIKIKESSESILSHYISTDVLLRYNGVPITINDVATGYDCVATYKDGKIYALDFTDALVDDIVSGSFIGASTSTAKGTVVNVYVIKDTDTKVDTSEKSAFKLSDSCVITYNGNTCAASAIKAGAYVKMTVKKGVVTVIEAQNKESTLTGRVEEVIMDPVYKLRIDATGKGEADYILASDVTVKRNGKTVTAREILAGDSISAKTSYGIITSITATSKSSAKTGIIKEVIISATPKITLTSEGVDTTYFVTSDAKITLSGVDSTFYDLRVGLSTSVELDSDTVVSIESVLSDEVVTWAGTVTLVNSSYGLIQIEFMDSLSGQTRTESVFVKSNASIVDYETQKSRKLSTVTPGMKVNVTGSMKTGVFEAGTVIIIG